MLYDYLIRYTPDGALVPCLATSWASSGNSWTFRLRRNVQFQDGTTFDASAVKAHFDRLLGAEKALLAYEWTPYVASIDVPDPYTIRFTTKNPDPLFPARLPDASIESPAAFKKYGKDLARHPVGTGPFNFSEWVPSEHITLVRNDTYWGDKAYLDRVVVRPIADPSARVIALQAGDVQLAIQIAPEQLATVQSDPRLALQVKDTLRYLFVGMNVLKKPFNDVRVRQALSYAIDKNAIVKNLYGSLAEVLPGPVPRGAAGYSPVAGFRYDPRMAKQLLAEAGYPNGFTATMTGPQGRYLKDFELEQAVQQQLAAIGVTLRLQVVEWARYLELVRMPPTSSPLEIWLDAWAGNEAGQIIERRFGCRDLRPNGANTTGFCNLDVDGAVAQAEANFDQAARNALLKQAQDLITPLAPSIWLLQVKQAIGFSRKLHNPVLMNSEQLTVSQYTWLEA